MLPPPSPTWFCNGTVGVPSTKDTAMQRVVMQTDALRPLNERKCFPQSSEKEATSPVSSLRSPRSPAAVLRGIRAVVVNAVYAALRRALPHVSNEGGYGLQPLWTYRDASCAIITETSITRVCTPVYHAVPSVIFSSARPAVFGNALFEQASTRVSRSAMKITSGYVRGVPAGASTRPHRSSTGIVFSAAQYSKSAIRLAYTVYEFWHSALLNVRTAVRMWQVTVRSLFGSYPIHKAAL